MEDELSCLDDYEKETLKNLLRKVSHAAENRAPLDGSHGQNKEANGKNS